jgi:hypothetical protein
VTVGLTLLLTHLVAAFARPRALAFPVAVFSGLRWVPRARRAALLPVVALHLPLPASCRSAAYRRSLVRQDRVVLS